MTPLEAAREADEKAQKEASAAVAKLFANIEARKDLEARYRKLKTESEAIYNDASAKTLAASKTSNALAEALAAEKRQAKNQKPEKGKAKAPTKTRAKP
jgi:hypothetical protein